MVFVKPNTSAIHPTFNPYPNEVEYEFGVLGVHLRVRCPSMKE